MVATSPMVVHESGPIMNVDSEPEYAIARRIAATTSVTCKNARPCRPSPQTDSEPSRDCSALWMRDGITCA